MKYGTLINSLVINLRYTTNIVAFVVAGLFFGS